MATRSLIAIQKNDGSYRAIFCHWDGAPRTRMPILTEHYNTEEKVNSLIDLGHLSAIGNTPESCVAHHRDWKQPLVIFEHISQSRLREHSKSQGAAFVYIFKPAEDGGDWTYINTDLYGYEFG